MKFDDISKILENHEKRILALEGGSNKNQVDKILPDQEFSGMMGGIRFLISENFFTTPRSLKEITEKLKENGYHYDRSVVQKTVAGYFMKRDKILTRFKEGKHWKYVIKK